MANLSREVITVGGPNLFNIDDPDVVEGRFVNVSNGNLNVNAAHNASHFIGVSPDEDIYISNAERYAWYDADQTFIEGFDLSRGEKQLVVPEGAAFVRFSVDRTLDGVIVALSATALPFEPYVEPLISSTQVAGFPQLIEDVTGLREELDQLDGGESESDDSVVSALFTNSARVPSATDNIFNINDPGVAAGFFVNQSSGNLNGNAAHNASHFIEVTPGEDIYVSNAERYSWYDADQTFIEGFDLSRGEKQLVVPEDAEFFRFSVDRTLTNVIVARSPEAVPFTPFQSSSSIIGLTTQGQELLGFASPVDKSILYRLLANQGNRNTWVLPQNVLYIGDSFWNNTTDISAEAIRISGIPGRFNGTSVPGSTLSQIGTVLNGLDLTPYDTIVIGRGTNDQVGGGIDLATYQVRILTVLGFFVGLNKQIMLANIPPLGHYVNYNATFQASIDEKNDWTATLFDPVNSSFRVFDINSALDTTGDGRIDDELAIGDTNIHPNPAGGTAAATALVARWQP